jgi:hypothetical protein
MSDFDSLTWALDGLFDTPLCDLPDAQRRRVERDFPPLRWDNLSADQRRSKALQWDYQHDPATEQSQQFWWNFLARQGALERQIAQWEAAGANTAGDLDRKEKRLTELRQEHARMELQQKQARGDYHPKRKRPEDEANASCSVTEAPVQYIPYPDAMRLLADRLTASPDELAAWVWMGPDNGGLAGYTNANELTPPPRFYYSYPGDGQGADYLGPLMACWFRVDDIAGFAPTDRFISGKELEETWGKRPGIQAEAFIRAKIAESRLDDIHPIFGTTQGTFPEDSSLPPLKAGLFLRSQVAEIEASDFGVPQGVRPDSSLPQQAAPALSANEWHIQNARKAADARHNKAGGTREKRARIREIWASGKFSSRNQCAAQECDALDMSYDVARNALIGTPDPK